MTALSETENDPTYLIKAEKALDMLFAGETENDFIKSIWKRISKKLPDNTNSEIITLILFTTEKIA